MEWRLRYGTEHDIDAIMAIETPTFGAGAWTANGMVTELRNPQTRYFVGARPETPALIEGYAGLFCPPGSPEADVQTIAVASAARRTGLGRLLMTSMIAEARTRGADAVFLEVRADNPGAQSLYLSLGFEQIAVRAGYYQSDGMDALVMRLPLTETARGVSAESEPLVLGIETSCDETGIGIVRGTTLLANVIASSMEQHAPYGGVVPEIAARAHLEALTPAIEQALQQADARLADLDAIAVTAGPRLAGALMVGIGAAKALSVALDTPLYAVNHLVGHVGADVLRTDGGEFELPTVALLVSGGHTSLLLVRDLVSDVQLLGETIDDAAGEAFDKVARLLGLAYPGGPEIDRMAASGDPSAIAFPRGLTRQKDLAEHRYDFSFSGLKTAVARWVERRVDGGGEVPVADVAASFREAVADVLVTKALDACATTEVPRLLLGGGVAANARVRALAEERCALAGVELRIPPLRLCTDNGAMIAALGAQLVIAGHGPSALTFGAASTLPVTTIQL